MDIVFCADHAVLPGLHVAAYSLLESADPSAGEVNFHIFSDKLLEADIDALRASLGKLGRPFHMRLCRIEESMFRAFPPLNGGWATYYRLAVPGLMDCGRFLYVDADTMCAVDVAPLFELEMGNHPAALVPEAPLSGAADRVVAQLLGNSPEEPYFNAGVILVNVAEWKRQRITERSMDYLLAHRPDYWDQSALNVVLHRCAMTLDERYNHIANKRSGWPVLVGRGDRSGFLMHFLDYPKPWDLMGEFIHPQYRLWRSVLAKTAMKNFRSWQSTPARRLPKTRKAWIGYKNALKDRILFLGYSHGWLKAIKGVPRECNKRRAGVGGIH